MAWVGVEAPAPLYRLTVGVGGRGVLALCFRGGERAARVAATAAGHETVDDDARTDEVRAQLTDYLAGRRTTFDLTLDWSLTGGAQRVVLQTLFADVKYGETTTYGELARTSGAFAGADGVIGARAVGQVMGGNPMPVIVPCHRVLAADGLGGFNRGAGGGLELKRWLLELEGALPPTLGF